METIEAGDKTAVRFTFVFNNDVINKNTAVRFNWFQNSFETFETISGGSFQVWVLDVPDKIQHELFKSEIIFADSSIRTIHISQFDKNLIKRSSKSNSNNIAPTQFSELGFASLNPTGTQLEPNEPSSWLVSVN